MHAAFHAGQRPPLSQRSLTWNNVPGTRRSAARRARLGGRPPTASTPGGIGGERTAASPCSGMAPTAARPRPHLQGREVAVQAGLRRPHAARARSSALPPNLPTACSHCKPSTASMTLTCFIPADAASGCWRSCPGGGGGVLVGGWRRRCPRSQPALPPRLLHGKLLCSSRLRSVEVSGAAAARPGASEIGRPGRLSLAASCAADLEGSAVTDGLATLQHVQPANGDDLQQPNTWEPAPQPAAQQDQAESPGDQASTHRCQQRCRRLLVAAAATAAAGAAAASRQPNLLLPSEPPSGPPPCAACPAELVPGVNENGLRRFVRAGDRSPLVSLAVGALTEGLRLAGAG